MIYHKEICEGDTVYILGENKFYKDIVIYKSPHYGMHPGPEGIHILSLMKFRLYEGNLLERQEYEYLLDTYHSSDIYYKRHVLFTESEKREFIINGYIR